MPAMNYEYALRYVFDRCGRGGGPNGIAEADIWRHASLRNDFSDVMPALAQGIQRLIQDSADIEWSANERSSGGIYHNYIHALQRAQQNLSGETNLENACSAIAGLMQAMKGLILKQTNNIPAQYRGDE